MLPVYGVKPNKSDETNKMMTTTKSGRDSHARNTVLRTLVTMEYIVPEDLDLNRYVLDTYADTDADVLLRIFAPMYSFSSHTCSMQTCHSGRMI